MKENLRTVLFRKPTLFPWLIVFLLGVMIFYIVIGIWAMTQASEGIMALLMAPYLIPVMVILAGADFALRKMLSQKFGVIWVIEVGLTLAWAAWFGYRNYYQTIFITEKTTPLIVLVNDPLKGHDLDEGKNLLRMRSEIPVPADNILLSRNFPGDAGIKNMRGKSLEGDSYSQVYFMSYSGKDTIRCGNLSYPIQFIMMESEKYPHFLFGQTQFDSMRTAICSKLKK